MTRIYYPFIDSTATNLTLEGQEAHYLLNVLRIKTDDALILFDGQNNEYQATVTNTEKKRLQLSLQPPQMINRESPLNIHLIQGISKGERMDIVMQKATELGVTRITPIYTQHTAININQDRHSKKLEHWKNITISACEQCGRNTLPILDPIQSFSDILSMPTDKNTSRWILHPTQSNTASQIQTPKKSGIQLLIGPEGGFSISEVSQAESAGFTPLQLGPRILRTETAAIAAIAIFQSLLGDVGI